MEAGAGRGVVHWDPSLCTLCDACIKACPRFSSPRVRTMTAAEVMAEIAPSLPYIRGITVSGGECTLYPGFLRELGALAGEKGLSFFIDTNGSYDFSADPALLDRCGGVMPDIKADPDREDEHRRVTGAAAFDLLDRVLFLGRRGKLYEVRTVVSPGLFDAAALVEKVCRRLAGLRGLRYRLIRYRPAGVRPEAAGALAAPDDALMAELAKIAAAAGLEAVVV
jgi:pyruvate formate lyase activating enzyme